MFSHLGAGSYSSTTEVGSFYVSADDALKNISQVLVSPRQGEKRDFPFISSTGGTALNGNGKLNTILLFCLFLDCHQNKGSPRAAQKAAQITFIWPQI